MDKREAKIFLHPGTAKEAIGTRSEKEAVTVVEEACIAACDAIDKLEKIECWLSEFQHREFYSLTKEEVLLSLEQALGEKIFPLQDTPSNPTTFFVPKKDFMPIIKKHTVIHCKTKKRARKLLEWAEKQGWTWISKDLPTQHLYYEIYGEKTCFSFGEEGIEFADCDWYSKKKYPIISFDDFVKANMKKETEGIKETEEARDER